MTFPNHREHHSRQPVTSNSELSQRKQEKSNSKPAECRGVSARVCFLPTAGSLCSRNSGGAGPWLVGSFRSQGQQMLTTGGWRLRN